MVLFAFAATVTQAQTVDPTFYKFPSPKITTTTYATFLKIPPDVSSFQATVTKDSGTVGGYMFMECTVNGTDWLNCTLAGDSLTLTDVSTAQSKIWQISKLKYVQDVASFRIKIIPSGGGTRLLPTACFLQKRRVVYNTN
jgi:hypothetical protein